MTGQYQGSTAWELCALPDSGGRAGQAKERLPWANGDLPSEQSRAEERNSR